MVLSQDGSRLYVANGDSDSVTVIDTRREAVVTTISLPRPGCFKPPVPTGITASLVEAAEGICLSANLRR
jgi:YVTN family beta-propeller protein